MQAAACSDCSEGSLSIGNRALFTQLTLSLAENNITSTQPLFINPLRNPMGVVACYNGA